MAKNRLITLIVSGMMVIGLIGIVAGQVAAQSINPVTKVPVIQQTTNGGAIHASVPTGKIAETDTEENDQPGPDNGAEAPDGESATD